MTSFNILKYQFHFLYLKKTIGKEYFFCCMLLQKEIGQGMCTYLNIDKYLQSFNQKVNYKNRFWYERIRKKS